MSHTSASLAPKISYTSEAICAAFAEFGVAPARSDEIEEARDFAVRLIGGEIVTPTTLAWVHARTGAGLFLTRDAGELTGLLSFLLLSERGRRAVWADDFQAVEPDPKHLAIDGRAAAGVYNWGIAATRCRAVKRLIDGYELIRRQAVPHLAFFGRPVTELGRRLTIDRLKFKPVPGSKTGLVWIEPIGQQISAVAA